MRVLLPLTIAALIAACGSAADLVAPAGGAPAAAPADDGRGTPAPDPEVADDDDDNDAAAPKTHGKDGAASDGDAGADAAVSSPDGTPMRVTCTSTFGSGLVGSAHGRLDGTLVAIVAPGSTSQCNADSDHLHLQILMNGGTYDIAINVDGVDVAEKDAAIIDGDWSEGWHAGAALDYPTALGLHSGDFASIDKSPLLQHLEDALATVNHISVFATKYDVGGAHLIHRNGHGNDGALLLQPLSGQPHYIVFHFPNQTF